MDSVIPLVTGVMDNGYLLLMLEANRTYQRGELVYVRETARNLGNHQFTPVGSVKSFESARPRHLRTQVEGFSKLLLCMWASWYS